MRVCALICLLVCPRTPYSYPPHLHPFPHSNTRCSKQWSRFRCSSPLRGLEHNLQLKFLMLDRNMHYHCRLSLIHCFQYMFSVRIHCFILKAAIALAGSDWLAKTPKVIILHYFLCSPAKVKLPIYSTKRISQKADLTSFRQHFSSAKLFLQQQIRLLRLFCHVFLGQLILISK